MTTHFWHVQFAEQVYGPYGTAQMQAFVAEGRIIDTSLITHDQSRGFFRASAYPIFAEWVQQAQPVQPVYQEQPMQLAVGQSHPVSAPAAHTLSVFLVMAEIRSGQAMRFLQILQSLGKAQRIGDSVWLLQAANDVDGLRRALSQDLTKQDRLFIVDSFKNQTAWFNIGADMDQRIREFWDIPG